MVSQRQLLTGILAGVILLGVLFALYAGIKGGKLLSKAEEDKPVRPTAVDAFVGNALHKVNIGYSNKPIECPKNFHTVNKYSNVKYGDLFPGELIFPFDEITKSGNTEEKTGTRVGYDLEVKTAIKEAGYIGGSGGPGGPGGGGLRTYITIYWVVTELTTTPVEIVSDNKEYLGIMNSEEDGSNFGGGFTASAPLLSGLKIVRGEPLTNNLSTGKKPDNWIILCQAAKRQ